MIVLSLKDLDNPNFAKALMQLMNSRGYGGAVLNKLTRIKKIVDSELDTTREIFRKLWDEHVIKQDVTDEKTGKVTQEPVKIKDDKSGEEEFQFKDKEAYFKARMEVLDHQFEIKLNKLPIAVAEKANLSPAELAAVMELFDMPEEETPPPPPPGAAAPLAVVKDPA
jgi:hypothetical protein